jgi:hypothetical protein
MLKNSDAIHKKQEVKQPIQRGREKTRKDELLAGGWGGLFVPRALQRQIEGEMLKNSLVIAGAI